MGNKKHKKNNVPALITIVILLTGAVLLFLYMPRTSLKPAFWQEQKTGQKTALENKSKTEVALCRNITCEKWISPRTTLKVTTTIYASTSPEKKQKLQNIVKIKTNDIKDKVRSIVASAGLWQLTDPHLSYVKRQAKEQIGQIVGPQLIEKVFIPFWHTSRSQ